MRPVSAWGRLSRDSHDWIALTDRRQAAAAVVGEKRPAIAHGNGRSYGDVALNDGGVLWSTAGLDRFIAFDAPTGVVECEPGVTFEALIALALPHGWFPPVTPGTQFATLGGALANDVHGKNHHGQGTFGEHVEQLTLLRTDGARLVCGPREQPGWFEATIGGLGLTGFVERLRLRLRPVPGPWLETRTTAFESLGEFFALASTASGRHEYTVSWIDCHRAGRSEPRGLFFAADHAEVTRPLPRARQRRLPFAPPVSLVTATSSRAFNSLYFHRHRLGSGTAVRHYREFFYPLDHVLEWNRLYGPRGFYQYQCVVPEAMQADATAELLQRIAAARTGSFLAVLKTFGPRASPGLLSFPMPGTTLALDFPNQGASTLRLFEALDEIVDAAGGRLYPAKDARMPASLFRRGYPRAAEFEAFRDPGISSAMSRRLFGR